MGRRGSGRGFRGGRGGSGHHDSGGDQGFFEPSSGSPRFIEPVLLLLLSRMGDSYGYQLISEAEKLSFSFVPADSGSVYRVLRRMETEDLVISSWEFGACGPARRTYRITEQGSSALSGWIGYLRRHRDALSRLISLFDGI
jgi:PadR family transcriptional regulator PadR